MIKDPINVGTVSRPKGIRGDFFVSGRDAPLPKGIKVLWIGKDLKSAKPFHVAKEKVEKNRSLLKLEECADRTSIEPFVLQKIWVPKSEIPLDEGEYFWEDLKGLTVQDCDGLSVGVLREVYNYGASDCVEINSECGETSLNLPFIDDFFDIDRVCQDLQEAEEVSLFLTKPKAFFSELWEKAKSSR